MITRQLAAQPRCARATARAAPPAPQTRAARRRRPFAAAAAAAGNGAAAANPVVGVVIVDHGSRAAASNAMLLEFVDLYAATTGAPIVEAAHMEIAAPSIADAVGALARRRG
jgi:sirohydrochlorin ferrochelatase